MLPPCPLCPAPAQLGKHILHSGRHCPSTPSSLVTARAVQARQSMQPAHVAFELAPREKAAYMKRELGPGQSEEDGTTLGGALPASLRSWLRQVICPSVLAVGAGLAALLLRVRIMP